MVRAVECFSSSSLSNEKMKDEYLQSKMKQLTLKLVSVKVLQYSVGDKALLQFTEFSLKKRWPTIINLVPSTGKLND